MMDLVTGLQPRYRHRDPETREQKHTVVSVDREHRGGCAS